MNMQILRVELKKTLISFSFTHCILETHHTIVQCGLENQKCSISSLGITAVTISETLPVNLRNYIHILAHMANDLER